MAKSTSTPFLPGKDTIDVLTFYIKLGKRKGLPLSRTVTTESSWESDRNHRRLRNISQFGFSQLLIWFESWNVRLKNWKLGKKCTFKFADKGQHHSTPSHPVTPPPPLSNPSPPQPIVQFDNGACRLLSSECFDFLLEIFCCCCKSCCC